MKTRTTVATTNDMTKVCKDHPLFKTAGVLYGQIKIADERSRVIAEELPDRERSGLWKGIKGGVGGTIKGGLTGAMLGALGGPLGMAAGGVAGAAIGGTAGGVKGLLFNESKKEYANRLAKNHPELISKLISHNKSQANGSK